MTEGRIAETLHAAAGRTSGSGQLKHLQIASVPGRNAPAIEYSSTRPILSLVGS